MQVAKNTTQQNSLTELESQLIKSEKILCSNYTFLDSDKKSDYRDGIIEAINIIHRLISVGSSYEAVMMQVSLMLAEAEEQELQGIATGYISKADFYSGQVRIFSECIVHN